MTHKCKGHFSCACGNPLWKTLIPNGVNIQSSRLSSTKANNQSLTQGEVSRDRIFHATNGGTIQTLAGGKNKTVEAIGIKDGKIIAMGSLDEVKQKWPESAPTATLIQGSQFLQPAFIEPHVHIIPSATFNTGVDLSPFVGQNLRGKSYTLAWVVKQLSEATTQISASLPDYCPAQYAKGQPDSKPQSQSWLLGHNIDPSLLQGEDKSFNKNVLDKASTSRPIMVLNTSGHLAYINSVVIEQINRFNGEPKKNKDYKLSSDEEPTIHPHISTGENGVLQEMAQILPVLEFLCTWFGRPSDEQITEQVNKVFTTASERGVTYMLDALLDDFQMTKLKSYATGKLEGFEGKEPIVRIAGAYGVDSLTQLNNSIIGTYQPNHGDENFNLAYLKLISDGSAQGLTAYQYTPYNCDENYNEFGTFHEGKVSVTANDIAKQTNTGLFNYGYPIEFNAIVQKANMSRWPLMIHANGDHAIARTINAYRAAGMNKSIIDQRRDRIEHCSLLTRENMNDMQEIGISPSFTIGHVGYWGWGFQNTIIGEQRANQLDLCRTTLTDYGMRITLHSDYSVTPLGPLRMMEQSITRLMEDVAQGNPQKVLNPAECLTPFQALKAMTYDAAWQCHADKWVGSLEVGKCADFVILAESPLTYQNADNLANPAQGMRNIPVLETWKGGKQVHSGSPNFASSRLSNVRYHADHDDKKVLTFNYLAPYIKDSTGSLRGHINAAFQVSLQVEGASSPILLRDAPIKCPLDQVCYSLDIKSLVDQIPNDKAYTLTLEAGPALNETANAVFVGAYAIAASTTFTLSNKDTTDCNAQSTVVTEFALDEVKEPDHIQAAVTLKIPPNKQDVLSDSWVVIIDPSTDAKGQSCEQATFGWGNGQVAPNGKNVIAYQKLTLANETTDGLYKISTFVKPEGGASLNSGKTYRAGVCLLDTYQLCAFKDVVYAGNSQKIVNSTANKDKAFI